MAYKAALFGAAASVACLACADAASAAHFNGWYVGIEGGASWLQDIDAQLKAGFNGGPVTFSSAQTLESDTGWILLGTAGYAFNENWRGELEVGYRFNDIEHVNFSNPQFSPTVPDAHLGEWTIMANVAYDFDLGDRWGMSLGAGIGVDDTEFRFRPSLAPSGFFDDSDLRFAYQAIVGFTYSLGEASAITLTYRYLGAMAPSWDGTGLRLVTTHFEADDIGKHAFTLGLRFDLHPEPVPVEAPPPPPPPPPRSFVIFFGFNKCNITAEADTVLSEAASAAKSTGSANVTIVGHTDSSGSPKYNQKLSECRAQAAASNLESKGVAAGTISASGKGETELMVQTGDGVKEPQNRRATVDLH